MSFTHTELATWPSQHTFPSREASAPQRRDRDVSDDALSQYSFRPARYSHFDRQPWRPRTGRSTKFDRKKIIGAIENCLEMALNIRAKAHGLMQAVCWDVRVRRTKRSRRIEDLSRAGWSWVELLGAPFLASTRRFLEPGVGGLAFWDADVNGVKIHKGERGRTDFGFFNSHGQRIYRQNINEQMQTRTTRQLGTELTWYTMRSWCRQNTPIRFDTSAGEFHGHSGARRGASCWA